MRGHVAAACLWPALFIGSLHPGYVDCLCLALVCLVEVVSQTIGELLRCGLIQRLIVLCADDKDILDPVAKGGDARIV